MGTFLFFDEIELGGRRIGYTVQGSGRTRRLGLRIAPETGLVVTAPPGTREEFVRTFLGKHRRWIVRWTTRMNGHAATPRRWPYGPHLLLRGEPHTVLVRQASASSVEQTADRRLLVATRTGTIEAARRVLRRWLTTEAIPLITQRVEVRATAMGLRPRRVYVRSLRSGWGYCWPGGSVSFSDRLIMAPPTVLDYVIVHELLHLWERNHSTRFWALVARHVPGYQDAKRWLRTYGPALSV